MDKIDILNYLIETDCNYIAAHQKFNLSYNEIAPFVDQYKDMGIDGLILAKEYLMDKEAVLNRLNIQLKEIDEGLKINPDNLELIELKGLKRRKMNNLKRLEMIK